jgi:hypothetical protein
MPSIDYFAEFRRARTENPENQGKCRENPASEQFSRTDILVFAGNIGKQGNKNENPLETKDFPACEPVSQNSAGWETRETNAVLPAAADYDFDDLTTPENILAACRSHGVALRIDDDGDLVVGKAGAKAEEPTQPWPALIAALEIHLEAVARLVESGWHLRAGLPTNRGKNNEMV